MASKQTRLPAFPLRAAALAALILLLPGPGLAQTAPAPAAPGGAAARPTARAGTPGLAPLQTEPGDIWAEVRSWSQGKGAAKAEAPPPRPRRPAPCTAGTAGCAAKPPRPAANPG